MGFEAHAIVELMGHARIAGKVSEETIAGAALLRVDVPKTEQREAYTKFYSAGAVYSITPTDEATANYAAEQFNNPPVSPYILRMPVNPALAEKIESDDEMDVEDDEDNFPTVKSYRDFNDDEIPF